MKQVELNFEGGLTDQFPLFRDCIRSAVYGCGRQFKAVAADLDMSPSKLSRMLADNPNDTLNFPLDLLPSLIDATKDKSPIYWLIESFLEDPEQRRNRAVSQIESMLPQLSALLKQAQA